MDFCIGLKSKLLLYIVRFGAVHSVSSKSGTRLLPRSLTRRDEDLELLQVRVLLLLFGADLWAYA